MKECSMFGDEAIALKEIKIHLVRIKNEENEDEDSDYYNDDDLDK